MEEDEEKPKPAKIPKTTKASDKRLIVVLENCSLETVKVNRGDPDSRFSAETPLL